MPAGWTVAAVLAHLAFWDQRIVVLIERIKSGATVPGVDSRDGDWINDAAKPLQLALHPRVAATLAVEAARAADHAVATLSEEWRARNAAAGNPIKLLRAEHRREHLDEIDPALTAG